MSIHYTQKVDAVIYSHATEGFQQADWLGLVMAALDQAGLSVGQQTRLAKLLELERSKLSSVNDP